jgi:hypothetical protein
MNINESHQVIVALPEVLAEFLDSDKTSSHQASISTERAWQPAKNSKWSRKKHDSRAKAISPSEFREDFKPYLLVEAGEAKFPMSAESEAKKYLSLTQSPSSMQDQSLLEFVYEFIQQHMQKNAGKLCGYGYISRYYLVYSEKEMLELSPSGHILGIRESILG